MKTLDGRGLIAVQGNSTSLSLTHGEMQVLRWSRCSNRRRTSISRNSHSCTVQLAVYVECVIVALRDVATRAKTGLRSRWRPMRPLASSSNCWLRSPRHRGLPDSVRGMRCVSRRDCACTGMTLTRTRHPSRPDWHSLSVGDYCIVPFMIASETSTQDTRLSRRGDHRRAIGEEELGETASRTDRATRQSSQRCIQTPPNSFLYMH